MRRQRRRRVSAAAHRGLHMASILNRLFGQSAAAETAPSSGPGAVSPPTAELGVTGLKRSSGRIREEWVPELVGPQGMKVYREMADNCAAVGGCLGATESMCREVSFSVEPFRAKAQEDLQRAAFLDTCLNDMSFSWADTLSEILSMLQYGFSAHEVVYKRRGGDVNDPASRSRYSDGLVGWRKLPIRAQETVAEWDIDEAGGIQGLIQVAAPDYKRRTIPISAFGLFRPKIAKNNPEGRSILRSAYRSYYYWKRTLEIEGIGIERDLAGFPVMGIPAACLSADATPEQKATYEGAKELVTSLRRDELEGAVIGLAYEAGGSNPLYKLELLSTGGSRQFDTSKIIEQRSREIILSMLYDLLIMGQPNTLQYKGSKMPEFFAVSLGAWLDSVTNIFNDFLIPRLWRMNGWPLDRLARLCHGDIQVPDLAALGSFLTSATGAKALFPDESLEGHLRRMAGLPEKDPRPAQVGATGDAKPPAGDQPAAVPPAPDAPGIDAAQLEAVPDFVLNGAQITAATAIVLSVAAGAIPRDSGLGQIEILFNLTRKQAEQIMGSAGTDTPTTPNPRPGGAAPAPGEPPTPKPPVPPAPAPPEDPKGDGGQPE